MKGENMTDTALTVRNMGFDEVMRLGPVLAQSGYFQDAKQASQAIVKVLAGQEMGFGPIASMVGVHIISGKPAPGANLMASAVKRNPHYDYKIVKLDDDVCILAFFENGQKVGESSFSAEDAKKAGTKNMDRFPRNMLFARAISNGVRWFCPDVFGGVTAYTPEELGANVDENGDVIDVTPTPYHEPDPTQTPPSTSGNGDKTTTANGKSKPASIKSQSWADYGKALAATTPYYQNKDGAPDWFHMTGAAGKLGIEAITDENLEQVIDALRTYAHEQQKEAGQAELPL